MERFTCYIIGNDNVALECARILNDFGHKTIGFFTDCENNKEWCANEAIPALTSNCSDLPKADFIFDLSCLAQNEKLHFLASRLTLSHNNPFSVISGTEYEFNELMRGTVLRGSWIASSLTQNKQIILQEFNFVIDDVETITSLNNKYNEQAIASFSEIIVKLSREEDSDIYPVFHDEFVLSKQFVDKINFFASYHKYSLTSIITALFLVFINRYNQTKTSHISISDKSDFFVPNTFISKSILHIDILDDSFNSLINKINPIIYTDFISLQGQIEFHGEESNILFRNQSKGILFNGVIQSNIQMNYDSKTHTFHVYTDTNLNRLYHLKTLRQNLELLLDALIENAAKNTFTLPIVCDEESIILKQYSKPEHVFHQTGMLHQEFEKIAETYPSHIALIYEQKTLSYSELNQKANCLARYIRQQYANLYNKEFEKNVHIGICVDRGFEMVIAILAVLKAGGVYVPLDPSNPTERLDYIINDSQASILITQTHLASSFQSIPIIDLTQHQEVIFSENACNVCVQAAPSDIAYIIYTSGSTGKPKGVLVPHQGAWNMTKWTIDQYPITCEDVLIQIASYAFDFSVWEIFAALMSGASLVLTASEKYKDPHYLLDLMIKNKVSILGGVPTLFKALFSCKEIKKWTTLKAAVCGAEPLTAELCRKFFSLFQAKLFHGYGPTEASITSTHWTCTKNNYLQGIFIGRPIGNTYLYVLDEQKKYVPLGVAGELYIGGIGVAKGYLNKDELTKDRFIANPFHEDNAPILYKTGDLVRWTQGGHLEFLGRADHQIKLRGFRIELLEIEHAIKQLDTIRDCVVIINSINNESYLIAYYVVDSQDDHIKNKLHEHIKKMLPYYMIPSYFIELEKLPLTPSGKIDRNNLPLPNQNTDVIFEGYIAPVTEIEKQLATTVEEILKLDKVGLLDNFFNLGGNSLSATQVISKINTLLNVNCTVAELFKYPIISDLANYLSTMDEHHDIATRVKIVSRDIMQPLSFAQQRIWFMYQYEDQKSSTYNIPIAYELNGCIDVSSLEKAFNILVERHETLRTIFKNVNGVPYQVILPSYPIKLECVPISQDHIQDQIEKESHYSFDLEMSPPISVKLYQIAPEKYVLFINQHNIITDGWSVGVLINEINETYQSLVQKSSLALPMLPFQYVDFALWQREYLENQSINNQLIFWQEYLHQFTEVILKTDKPRPKTQTYVGDHLRYEFPVDLVKKVDQLAQKNNATLFMVLVSALNIILHRYTGNDDIVIGTGIAGRNRKDIENLLGFFVNTLAIRNSLAGNPTFMEFLHQVKTSCLGVYANQDIPFEILVDKLKIDREPNRTPVFQVMFLLQDANDDVFLNLPNINAQRLAITQKVAMFDITINVTKNESGLSFDIQYNTDLFYQNTIHNLCKHIHVLLEGIVQAPNHFIHSYNILPENQIQDIFTRWNSTEIQFPSNKTIIELFEENIETVSDKDAIVAHNGKLTYRELITKINTIAANIQNSRYFTNKNKKNAVVAVCLNRDILLIPSILGVLKAGMAYIPLDPNYPEKRLQHMLEHADVQLIVTEKAILDKMSILNHDRFEIICVDQMINHEAPLPVMQSADDLAYVIFTSGSTGKPKGILVENRSVVNLICDMQKRLNFHQNDIFLSVTSISFDIFGLEMLLPLLFKGKVVLCPPCVTHDPELLIKSMIEHAPSVIQATPSSWNMMADLLLEKNMIQRFDILCGGEPLDKTLAVKLEKVAKRFLNVYGPAETTIWSTCNEVTLGDTAIGKPLSNTYCFVLDNHLNLVPPGMPGELYIGGIGVARGYINSPDLTQMRFIPNPFGSLMNIKLSPMLYKTGDIVSLRCDGKLNFIGRNDEQIKIRGYRIEAEEVNAVINAYDNIKSAIVIIKKYADEEMQIIAYFVPKKGIIDLDHLRQYLSMHLPDYMIPTDFVSMDALPLNSNNKVDKMALPVISNMLATRTKNYVEPKTSTQKWIADLWMKALKLDKMSIDTSFFALGGHSLLIPQIIIAINAHFNTGLTIRDFIQNLTIEKLSSYIAQIKEIELSEA